MAEVVDGGGAEGTLVVFNNLLVVAQDLEDEPNMVQVLSPCTAVDEYVKKKAQTVAGSRVGRYSLVLGMWTGHW